jgi:hypothetical protein
MKKPVKLLVYTLISLVCLFLLLVAFAWFSQDKIKQYAIAQINTQLTAPVSVRSVDITFIEQFPRVSLLFNEVSIADPIRPKHTLLQTKRLFIAFNLYDILTNDYNIKRIEADSGFCNLYINEQNQSNFQIIKKDTSNTSNNLLVSLQSIYLNHINLRYENVYAKQLLRADLQEMNFAGSFKTGSNELSAEGELFVNSYKTGQVQIIRGKQMSLDATLFFDETRSTYTFRKGDFTIGNLALNCTGTITDIPQYTLLDINFQAHKLSITDLLELLPGSVNESVKAYKSSGNIYFKGSIKGKSSAKQQPAIQVAFGVENGTIDAGHSLKLTQLNCKGTLSNGFGQSLTSSELKVSSFAFKLGNGNFSGDVSIQNFNNPAIDLNLNGQTPLQDLVNFSGGKWVQKADGNLEAEMHLKGNLAQLKKTNGWLQSESSGHVYCKASGIEWTQGNSALQALETRLTLNGPSVKVEQFDATFKGTDLSLTGSIQHFIPWLLGKNQLLEADLSGTSASFNPHDIELPISATNQNTEHAHFALPENIVLNTRLNIQSFTFKTFSAQQLKGEITWKGKRIETSGISCQSMNGSLKVIGQIENAPDGRFLVNAKLDCNKVDMQELFKQCDNFGQQEITDRHIRGQLTTQVELLGVWSPTLECETDKLTAVALVHITNGQLVNYKTLEALAKYVSIDDLRNLKFADLKNTIEIRNRTIFIPTMEVQNNALNISITGNHTFDNMVDYHFKLKLGDVLAKKYKIRSNEFEEEVQGEGMFVYIQMKGPASNPQFSYDKKQVREKMKADLKQEREEVKKVWRKELGLDDENKVQEKKTDSDELEFEQE